VWFSLSLGCCVVVDGSEGARESERDNKCAGCVGQSWVPGSTTIPVVGKVKGKLLCSYLGRRASTIPDVQRDNDSREPTRSRGHLNSLEVARGEGKGAIVSLCRVTAQRAASVQSGVFGCLFPR